MVDPVSCELHEVAILAGPDDSEDLLRLARSPIADECRMCNVCRYAGEYVELRMAERSGQVFPPQENSEAVLRRLQSAVHAVKGTVHRTK